MTSNLWPPPGAPVRSTGRHRQRCRGLRARRHAEDAGVLPGLLPGGVLAAQAGWVAVLLMHCGKGGGDLTCWYWNQVSGLFFFAWSFQAATALWLATLLAGMFYRWPRPWLPASWPMDSNLSTLKIQLCGFLLCPLSVVCLNMTCCIQWQWWTCNTTHSH